ncbi:hypothetical protein N0V84_006711 [Fusarium piperis]|uniref:Uncharacterized protein n=1 Tax=Fusarium piperis TaxID=1435070 RepID=A0A9W8WBG5_9HYPO|nr:hypothetical protein N0V84_006711 [Fusarium piperis]
MSLLHQFIWRRGLASRTAMSFMVAAALLILAFPTVASSMTGYTTVNKAYIEVPETGLIEFSTTYPAAYVIHDGSRIGLQDEYLVRLKDVPDRFQWGFSFLQVLALSILLLFWTIGIAIMWTKARMTLKLNGCSTHLAGWKSLLEFASTIEAELKEAGIDHQSLDDDQLDEKIQTVLYGGSVSSSDVLPRGIYSLRHGLVHDEGKGMPSILTEVAQGIDREKWWFLALILWLPACLVRTKIVNMVVDRAIRVEVLITPFESLLPPAFFSVHQNSCTDS